MKKAKRAAVEVVEIATGRLVRSYEAKSRREAMALSTVLIEHLDASRLKVRFSLYDQGEPLQPAYLN